MKKFLIILSSICSLVGESCALDISFLNSKETEYKGNKVTCKGDVVVVYNKKVISADLIEFDEKSESISAFGDVVMKDEIGNTYFADELVTKHNFKSGYVTNLKIITVDKSRLAAKKCEIKDGEYLLDNVIYTPCYECTKSGALTWQLKSEHVIFNPENYTEYRHAVLEAYNVPVLYTPYLMHVSHNIKRKSGFLRPKESYTTQQGLGLMIPYLISISDSQELILKPILTTRIGHVPWFYYGFRFPNGEFTLDASLTGTKSIEKTNKNDKTDKISRSGYRGHIFSKLCFELSDTTRAGINVNLTSDRYYMKRFSFFDDVDRTLESRFYIERFEGRNYTMFKSAIYQSEFTEVIPKLLPMLEHSHYIQWMNGTLNINFACMNLVFDDGRLSQKVVCNPIWSKEILMPGGHLVEVEAGASMQGLKVSEEYKTDYDSHFQLRPQLHLTWKWPLLLTSRCYKSVLTPIVGVNLSSTKKYYDAFENPFDEVNETNVFANNRSVSPYNMDSGYRYYYGFQLNGYCRERNMYHLALGESFELTAPEKRLESSGMKHKRSNLVGVLNVFLTNNLFLSSNASYSRKHKRFDRLESSLNYNNEKFFAGVNLFKGKQCFYNPFEIKKSDLNESIAEKKYKGLSFNTGYKVNSRVNLKYEIVFGNEVESLSRKDKTQSGKLKLLKQGIGIDYQNECATISLRCKRENKRGGDLRPETSVNLVVQLKNLG